MRDVVIIGGGQRADRGCTAGKAGLKPLVLERAEQVGGCAATSLIAPGFRVPAARPSRGDRSHADPRALGTGASRPEDRAARRACLAPTLDGRALTLWANTAIGRPGKWRHSSSRDAEAYPRFLESIAAVGRVLRRLMTEAPPETEKPRPRICSRCSRRSSCVARPWPHQRPPVAAMAGDAGGRPAARVVREPSRSAPHSPPMGVLGAFLGPRSPGSAAVLLMLGAREGQPVAPGWTVHGGIGATRGRARRGRTSIGRRSQDRPGSPTDRCERWRRPGRRRLDRRADPGTPLVVSNLGSSSHAADDDRSGSPARFVPEGHSRYPHEGHARRSTTPCRRCRDSRGSARWSEGEQAAALSGCVRLCRGMVEMERAFDAATWRRPRDEPWIEPGGAVDCRSGVSRRRISMWCRRTCNSHPSR